MGNFDSLKTAIAEVIKQNGNEEITGDVLQFVLLEMVSGLGAGYRFLGVCTPYTTPDEPDGAAFYVGGAGEYANFDGISPTVTDGYICFFKWDGSAWSYSALKVSQPVDTDITDGGLNPVTGGAIYNEFQKLRQAGYLFAGVAFPATDPGEVTEKVFYLASQAGNYQNFGSGIVLPWGFNIIRYNGSIWTGITVVEITDILSADNRALVTSGGVFTAMAGKVDKEVGKGLSENNYTNEEKTKLGSLPTAEALAELLEEKQDKLTFDATPTPESDNPVKSGGVYGAIKDFITKAVDDLINYYTKSQIYTKSEVDSLIAAIKQFQIVSVWELPVASAETMGKLYLVPLEDPEEKNWKEEYITLSITENDTTLYYWEKIGTTKIDLSDYPTFDQMNADIALALEDYYTKEQVNEIVSAALGDLATVTLTANKSVILTDTEESITVTGMSNISATELTITRDGNIIGTGDGKSLVATETVNMATAGTINYLLTAVIGGVDRTRQINVSVKAPVYYGAGTDIQEITNKASARNTPAGMYSIVTGEGDKFYFLVPYGMTINGVKMSGFDVPMEAPTSTIVDGRDYNCYVSSNTYDAGTYTVEVF